MKSQTQYLVTEPSARTHQAPRAVSQLRRRLAAVVCCAVAAFAHAQDPIPGSLHTTPFPGFASGNGKITNLAIGASDDFGQAVALQPDGKIVLAGYCYNGSNKNFCIARLNADGTLDASFDGPGGGGNGNFLLPIGASDDHASAIALQPDGKIVLAGRCLSVSNYDFCVARLNADGSLDASFDGPSGSGNGKFLLPIGTSDDFASAVALQPDGKIVMAGFCGNGSNNDFCVARLNADGTLDASFDGPSGSGNGKFLLPVGTSDDYLSAIALQPDGKIVLAGHCFGASNEDFCVARLIADGSLDTSFDGPSGGGNGKFLFLIGGGTDQATAVALQPDGKIVLAGTCTNGIDNDFCVARLNATGTLDASFDGPSGSGNGKFLLPIGATGDQATAVALQPDGKIVLAGGCLNGSNYDFCVARLNADGSLDSSFDGPSGSGNGKFLLPIGTDYDYANAVALQPDGKIVLAGTCGNFIDSYFCVARLNGGPFGAKQCSPDYDGDGKVLATTDILIGARVALGLTGNAVVGGITFAAHATRTTWPDIRTFLVSQCGMTIAQ